MRKLLFITIAAITAGGFVWHYLPPLMREKVGAFVLAAFKGDTGEMAHVASSMIVSENPVPSERRKVLIGELEKQVAVIRQGSAISTNRTASAPFQAAINSAEKIIGELKDANGSDSLGGEIGARVLDYVLPLIDPGSRNALCPAPVAPQ